MAAGPPRRSSECSLGNGPKQYEELGLLDQRDALELQGSGSGNDRKQGQESAQNHLKTLKIQREDAILDKKFALDAPKQEKILRIALPAALTGD